MNNNPISNNQLSIKSRVWTGHEERWLNQFQLIKHKQNSTEMIKEMHDFLMSYLSNIKDIKGLNKLFEKNINNAIKAYFKIVLENKSIAFFKDVVLKINSLSHILPSLNEKYVSMCSQFIDKSDLLKSIDVFLKSKQFSVAKELLVCYLCCFEKKEQINSDDYESLGFALDEIATVYEDVSYLIKGVDNLEEKQAMVFHSLMEDGLLLLTANQLFSKSGGKSIQPYELVRKLHDPVLNRKVSYHEKVTKEVSKIIANILIDPEVFYGGNDKQEIQTTQMTIESDLVKKYQFVKESVRSEAKEVKNEQRAQYNSEGTEHLTKKEANELSSVNKLVDELAKNNEEQSTKQSVENMIQSDMLRLAKENVGSETLSNNDSTSNEQQASWSDVYSNVDSTEFGTKRDESNQNLRSHEEGMRQVPRQLKIFGGADVNAGFNSVGGGVKGGIDVTLDKTLNNHSDTETKSNSIQKSKSSNLASSKSRNEKQDVGNTSGLQSSSGVQIIQQESGSGCHTADVKVSKESGDVAVMTGALREGKTAMGMLTASGSSESGIDKRLMSSNSISGGVSSSNNLSSNNKGTFELTGEERDRTTENNSTKSSVKVEQGDITFNAYDVSYSHTEKEIAAYLEYEFDMKLEDKENHDTVKKIASRLENRSLRREFEEINRETKEVREDKNIKHIGTYTIKYSKHPVFCDVIQAFNEIDSNMVFANIEDRYKCLQSIDDCLKICSDPKISGMRMHEKKKELCEKLYNLEFSRPTTDLNIEFDAKLDNYLKKLDAFNNETSNPYCPELPPEEDSGKVFYGKDENGFYIGARKRMSIEDSCQHALLIGGTGTGKTRRFIIPGLKKLNGQNALVTDVDGTIYHKTNREMRLKGYNVKVLDLINPEISNQFNPLKGCEIGKERIAQLVNALFCSIEDGNNKIFHENGKKIVTLAINLLIYEHEHLNGELPSLPALYKKVLGLTFENIDQLADQYKDLLEEDEANSELETIKSQLDDLNSNATNAYKEYYSFATTAVKELGRDIFKQISSGDDEIFDDLKDLKKNTIIYLRVQGTDIGSLNGVMGLFFQHFFSEVKNFVIDQKEKNEDFVNKPMLCFLDEFGNYKINNFATEVSTVRKFNIACMAVVQDKEQIRSKYGSESQAVLSCMLTKIYLNFDLTEKTHTQLSEAMGITKEFEVNLDQGNIVLTNERKLSVEKFVTMKKGYAFLVSNAPFIEYETILPSDEKDCVTPEENSLEADVQSIPEGFYLEDKYLSEIKQVLDPNDLLDDPDVYRDIESSILLGDKKLLNNLIVKYPNDAEQLRGAIEKLDDTRFVQPYKYETDLIQLCDTKKEIISSEAKSYLQEHQADLEECINTLCRHGVQPMEIIHLDIVSNYFIARPHLLTLFEGKMSNSIADKWELSDSIIKQFGMGTTNESYKVFMCYFLYLIYEYELGRYKNRPFKNFNKFQFKCMNLLAEHCQLPVEIPTSFNKFKKLEVHEKDVEKWKDAMLKSQCKLGTEMLIAMDMKGALKTGAMYYSFLTIKQRFDDVLFEKYKRDCLTEDQLEKLLKIVEDQDRAKFLVMLDQCGKCEKNYHSFSEMLQRNKDLLSEYSKCNNTLVQLGVVPNHEVLDIYFENRFLQKWIASIDQDNLRQGFKLTDAFEIITCNKDIANKKIEMELQVKQNKMKKRWDLKFAKNDIQDLLFINKEVAKTVKKERQWTRFSRKK